MRFLAFIFLLFLTIGADAQINFASVKLKEIYNLLPKNSIINIDHINSFTCNANGMALQVKTVSDNEEIVHIGLNLFGKDETEFYPESVYHFTERYFLELMLANNLSLFTKRSGEQKITLKYNGQEMAKSIFGNRQKMLSLLYNLARKEIVKDSLNYAVSLSDGTNQLLLLFPANNNLIRGMDKRELDKNLELKLRKYKLNGDHVFTFSEDKIKKTQNFYLLSGESYYKSITSDTYFVKVDNEYRLLWDKKYPAESLANTFISGYNNTGKQISVSHHQYGKAISRYTLFLDDFISFFRTDYCQLYVGIENNNPEKLQATMVVYNPFLNYVNIVYIDTTTDCLFDENKSISVKLYSNIPSDNIKDLFGTYIEGGDFY